jgi:hypothetical protein
MEADADQIELKSILSGYVGISLVVQNVGLHSPEQTQAGTIQSLHRIGQPSFVPYYSEVGPAARSLAVIGYVYQVHAFGYTNLDYL